MRRMSFMLTESQFLDGSKTVTRRLGWHHCKVGDRYQAVNKSQGLKPGEKARLLGVIEVVAVDREPLCHISESDVVREGFPLMLCSEFVAMFCKHMKCTPDTEVARIEFRRVR